MGFFQFVFCLSFRSSITVQSRTTSKVLNLPNIPQGWGKQLHLFAMGFPIKKVLGYSVKTDSEVVFFLNPLKCLRG